MKTICYHCLREAGQQHSCGCFYGGIVTASQCAKADTAGELAEAKSRIATLEAQVAELRAKVPHNGWKLVPIEPTHLMISAMATSQAKDDEGEFPSLMDLIDFSGENKTHCVLRTAYSAALITAPAAPVEEQEVSRGTC